MEIFDIHHHLGSLSGGSVLTGEAAAERDYQSRLAMMRENKVDCAAILGATGYMQADGIKATMRCNDTIAAYRKLDPARFPVAAGLVEPLHGDASLGELERIKHELGLNGIVWHNRFQGVAVDHQLMRPLLRKMSELGLVPFLHVNAESNMEAAWRLERLANEFPELTFIAMDAFWTNNNSQIVIEIAKRVPNILWDTSHMHGERYIKRFVVEAGSDKMVLGSTYYSSPPSYRKNQALQMILEAEINDADKANILALNAKRLFKLG